MPEQEANRPPELEKGPSRKAEPGIRTGKSGLSDHGGPALLLDPLEPVADCHLSLPGIVNGQGQDACGLTRRMEAR